MECIQLVMGRGLSFVGVVSPDIHTCLILCSVSGHIYKLCASNSNEALTWVEKLQEKRGEYIKVNDMRKKTASDQEKDRRTLRPLLSNPVGLLAREESSPQRSPPNVRKIVNAKIG